MKRIRGGALTGGGTGVSAETGAETGGGNARRHRGSASALPRKRCEPRWFLPNFPVDTQKTVTIAEFSAKGATTANGQWCFQRASAPNHGKHPIYL